MKRTLLLTVLILSTLPACFAQYSHTRGMFSIGIEGSFVHSDDDQILMSSLFKNGIGGSIKIDLPVYPNIYFTVAGGISRFEATDQTKANINQLQVTGYPTSENFVPLKMGVKCYAIKGLFAEIQAGCVFRSGKSVEFGNTDIFTAYSAGIGYLFRNGIELNMRYELWKSNGTVSKMDQVGVRLAYAVKFPHF